MKSRGFTLLELMIVIFLMSLIVGITTVFFAGTLPSAKQKAAATELAATIKYARHLAFIKNETQTIEIDLDARTYSLKGRETKIIPPEISLAVYGNDVANNPVRQGKFYISYDATMGSDWNTIELARAKRIITIKADPIMVASVVGVRK